MTRQTQYMTTKANKTPSMNEHIKKQKTLSVLGSLSTCTLMRGLVKSLQE
jgi:hypothetical protein